MKSSREKQPVKWLACGLPGVRTHLPLTGDILPLSPFSAPPNTEYRNTDTSECCTSQHVGTLEAEDATYRVSVRYRASLSHSKGRLTNSGLGRWLSG